MNADASTQVLCMKQLSNYHSIIVGMHQHCKKAPAESDFTLKWQRGKIQVTLKQKCIAVNRLSELDSQKLGLKCKQKVIICDPQCKFKAILHQCDKTDQGGYRNLK